MEKVFEFVQSNPWAALIAFVAGIIGVIGVVYTIVTRIKDKPKSQLTVYKATQCLYTNKKLGFSDVELKRGDCIIEELYETVFVLENSGNRRIDNSDIIKSTPLKIVCDADSKEIDSQYGIITYRLFLPEIVKKNNISIIFAPDHKSFIINFDFLEAGEKIILRIRHHGRDSFLSCEGKIKSGSVQNKKKIDILCDKYLTGNMTPEELKEYNEASIKRVPWLLLLGLLLGIPAGLCSYSLHSSYFENVELLIFYIPYIAVYFLFCNLVLRIIKKAKIIND